MNTIIKSAQEYFRPLTPSYWRTDSRWMLLAYIVGAIAICACIASCRGGLGFNKSPMPPPPAPGSAGEAQTYFTLADLTRWSFIPGLILLVIGIVAYMPIPFFAPVKLIAGRLVSAGFMLVLIGVIAAILPFALDRYGDWVALGLIACGLAWYIPSLIRHWRRELKAKNGNGHCEHRSEEALRD